MSACDSYKKTFAETEVPRSTPTNLPENGLTLPEREIFHKRFFENFFTREI
jgi:hypothetical protein